MVRQASYRLQLPPSPHTQPDPSDPDDTLSTVTGQYNDKLTPTKPNSHPIGLLTPPDTVHVDRTAYDYLTEELRMKETSLAQAQEDLEREREDARIKLRYQDEIHTRVLEEKDADRKANEERIVDLEKRLASLQEHLYELTSERVLLDEQNARDRARILELEHQISVLRTEYHGTFTNLTAANNTITALQEELEARRATVGGLRATIDDLTRQYMVLEDKNKAQNEVIAKRKKHSLDLVNALTQSLTDIDLPFVCFKIANPME